MLIHFHWQSNDPQKSAFVLAGPVGEEANIALLPLPFAPESQTLSLQVPGLSAQRADGEYCYITYIKKVLFALQQRGIEATLFIEYRSVHDFATLQERRLKFLRIHAQKAIDDLKKTRNWIKDKRVAEIRQNLETTLRDLDMIHI